MFGADRLTSEVNMEYIVMVILALVGFGAYQLKKRNEAEVDAKLANTKGQDKQLEKDQINVQKEIKTIDAQIDALNKQRAEEAANRKNMSLAERAKAAKDKFGK